MSTMNGSTDNTKMETSVSNRHTGLAAYFFGPAAENHDRMLQYLTKILKQHEQFRQKFKRPDDPEFIPKDFESNPEFQSNTERLDTYLEILNDKLLMKYSTPLFQPRYGGHMVTDTSMPAALGYFSAMLLNANNATVELSSLTTALEMEAGKQLCKLVGFRLAPGATYYGFGEPGKPQTAEPWQPGEPRVSSWGHITGGGTIGNVEGLWAARNLKFYPISLRNAMRDGEELHFLEGEFKIHDCRGGKELKLLSELTTWELLNLKVDDILDIPQRLYDEYGLSPACLQKVMQKHSVQGVGQSSLQAQYNIKPLKVLVSSMGHYSIPKACSLTGIGSENLIKVPVTEDAQIDTEELYRMLKQYADGNQAVSSVVAVLGTTVEGAVDQLDEIVKVREKLQQEKGMSFTIHVDGAWGGYFASMRRPKGQAQTGYSLGFRDRVNNAYCAISKVDSITIDPHKSGYIQYPAGALCYRNEKMRHLLTWSSSYICRDNEPESIGVYGVEGSKPGASAVAVWLSNCVIGMGESGYGALLGEALYTSSILYANFVAMETGAPKYRHEFKVIPFPKLPNEDTPGGAGSDQKFIRERIIGRSKLEILSDPEALEMLRNLGSNLCINCFVINFKIGNKWNTDVETANCLNKSIIKRLSSVFPCQDPSKVEFFLTSSSLPQSSYGKCADTYKKRLGLIGDEDLFVLRNAVMSPYTASEGFAEKIADTFGNIIDEEIERLLPFCDPEEPKKHRFVVQGYMQDDGSVYLAYLPSFYSANSSHQVILSAQLDQAGKYKWNEQSDALFLLETVEAAHLPTLLPTDGKGTSFKARLWCVNEDETAAIEIQVTPTRKLLDRSLHARHRNAYYPQFMPFYVYGDIDTGVNISHILLKAPNIVVCADRLSLTLRNGWNKQHINEHLRRGCIVATKLIERVRQPFVDTNIFRKEEQEVEVELYADDAPREILNEAEPGNVALLEESLKREPIARGKLTGFKRVYCDVQDVNADGISGKRWIAGDHGEKGRWDDIETMNGPRGLANEWLDKM